MQILKYQHSMQRLRNSKPSRRATRLLWLSFALMSLLAVLNLTGCAANCPNLKEEPKLMPIGSVIDVSRMESDVRKLSKELQAQLNSAQKTTKTKLK